MEVTVQITKNGDWDQLNYIGPINEEAEVILADVSGKVGDKCIINFKQVEFVNSCGVRAWINFLREFEQNREIIFEECTEEIVMQINMIPNFKGKSTIQSVYGTYECDECNNTETILFEKDKNLPTDLSAELPKVKCSKCGSDEMEMDELEEEYFSFIEAS